METTGFSNAKEKIFHLNLKFNCSGAGQFDKKWSLQQKVSAIRLTRGLWGASLNTFLARIAAFPVWIPPLCLNFCSREIICTAEKQCAKNSLPKPTESYLASNGRCSLWSALPLAKLELWWKGFQIRKCEKPEKKSAVNGVTLSAALSSRTLETIENIKSLISERGK